MLFPGYPENGDYPSDRDSEEFRHIAENGTILRSVVGSTVHGLSVSDQDDRDEMGICIEPPGYVIGLKRFEQYEFRTAWERGRNARSGPGDLDLVIYSLRKWMRLALAGNPTVLLLLFAPEGSLSDTSRHVPIPELGRELRVRQDRILSDRAGHRFLGYLRAQRDRLEGQGKTGHTNRPELVEKYGFDTKFAGHMVRLGCQGAELLEKGSITLPMPEPWRSWIVELRRGQHTKQEALEQARSSELKIERLLREGSVLPREPNMDVVNAWIIDMYQYGWKMMERA